MEAGRKPSAGIIVIAVLSLLGSALCLLMGIFLVAIFLFAPVPQNPNTPFPPSAFKAIMIVSSLFYFGPAIWGILTGIGLFRLKEWARISIIVFSVLLIVMSAFSGLAMTLMPLPTPPGQGVDPSFTTVFRAVAGSFSLFLVSIGVWWLVFFNRAKVKQQFAGVSTAVAGVGPNRELAAPLPSNATPLRRPERPLSLTIIAWLLLVGCLFVPISMFLHAPGVLLTRIITGWSATLLFALMTAANLYIGIGLLRLWPNARIVGIYYYLFFWLNSVIFYLAPGGRSRMSELMQKSLAIYPWMRSWPGQESYFSGEMMPMVWFGAILGLVVCLIPVYFLVTRKNAYEAAAIAAAARVAA